MAWGGNSWDICWDYSSPKGCRNKRCRWKHIDPQKSNNQNANIMNRRIYQPQKAKNNNQNVNAMNRRSYQNQSQKAKNNQKSQRRRLPMDDKNFQLCWDYFGKRGCRNKNCQWKHVRPNENKNQCKSKPKVKKLETSQTYKNTMEIIQNIKKNQDEMIQTHNIYGVVVINAKELVIGTLCGIVSNVLYSKSSDAFMYGINGKSNKHKKGGQSAARFGRIYENKMDGFIKECAKKINQIFKTNKVDEIILCGNGQIKNKLLLSSDLNDVNVRSLMLETMNTKKGGVEGLNEVFAKIKQRDEDKSDDVVLIREIMQKAKDPHSCELISIGIEETLKAIRLKIIKEVVLSNDVFQFVIKKKTKPVKFIKNDFELHQSIKEMKIELKSDENGMNKSEWKIVGFMNYMQNLCKINCVKLKIVTNHSEVGNSFVTDFSGCVGVLHQSFAFLE